MTLDPEITVEEWVAAGQGCCGTDPDDDTPPPAPQRIEPTAAAAGPASDSGSGA